MGLGDGTFTDPQLVAEDIFRPASITSGDLVSDEETDLALVTSGGNIVLLAGQGDGTFIKVEPEGSSDAVRGQGSTDSADLNGDGYLDLITIGLSNFTNRVIIFLTVYSPTSANASVVRNRWAFCE